jgi:hypothetical protein
VQEIVRQDEKPGSLGPLVDQLLASTDADRHVTFIAAPQFLFGDGRKLFSGPAERLRAPLDEFVGDQVRAISVSLHVDDVNFFAELRVLGALDRKPDEFVQRYRERLGKLPTLVEEKTLRRFPRWLGEFAENLRADVENGQAVLRCYLPAVASHNLAQAIDLAIHEGGGSAVAVATPPAETKPQTVAEKVQRKIGLSFPREPLDRTLELWSAEVGVKVVMLGNDMMAEGITKNQPITDFKEENQPAEAILLKILMKASPQGKLVYVVKPESPGGANVIQITTRTAATARGDKLPASLAAPAADPNKKPK